MGIDPVTLSIGMAGAGSIMQGIGGMRDSRRQRQRSDRLEERAMGQIQGPGFLESLLRSSFNTGQDGIMQTLRAIPGGNALMEMSETGMPFDTSEFFESLAPMRARQQREGLSELRAGAPGLGQRFGSSMMRGEEDLVGKLLETYAAQDAATQFQAHESAAGRRLQAAGYGTGLTTGLMELLGQLEQGRQGMNLQAVGISGGIPQAGSAWGSAGQPMIDMGQLLLIRQLLGDPQATTTATPATGGTSFMNPHWNPWGGN